MYSVASNQRVLLRLHLVSLRQMLSRTLRKQNIQQTQNLKLFMISANKN